MEYLKIEDGIIVGHYSGAIVDEGCVPLAGEFWGCVGEPVAWYDEHWNRIDDVTLVLSGRKAMPEGMKFNADCTDFVAMDEGELIIAGQKPLPAHQKIVDDKLEPKTVREMWLDGSISTEEFASSKRSERDRLLSSTDKYLLADFPVDESYRQKIKEYRQLLRDITQSPEWPDVDIPGMPVKE